MAEVLAKLESAIADLKNQKQEFFQKLEQVSWKDDRTRDRISELTRDEAEEIQSWFPDVIPEKAPLPFDAHRDYQCWFSAVRVIVAKNQPDRLPELDFLYQRIKPELSDTHIEKINFFRVKDDINLQFDLLAAIPNHLKYSIYDIELEIYSILMDDELAAAKHLLSKGFLRPAGVLAGVLLERHLKNLLGKHVPPISFRKNATLSTLNDACKGTVFDLTTWRKVQHLADIRNLCAHDNCKEPRRAEVEDLISGVSSLLKIYN